ncbi:hypothetical protein LBMAG47_27380 [Planctomycetia bacterium]|nr:hypothetical protein LBMAG47_27380 [Planctomycetia bacterium]
MAYETVSLQQILREIAGRTASEQDADAIRLAADTLDTITSRLTLTAADRGAIYRASRYISQNDAFEGMAEDADTLDALLERTK